MGKSELDLKSLRYFGYATLCGIALIILTKFVRSYHLFHKGSTGEFIFGVMPNFAGAFMLIGMSNLFHQFLSNKKVEINFKTIAFYSLISFFSLFAWEIVQFYAWHYNIDINDIIASFLASSLILLISGIFFKKSKL